MTLVLLPVTLGCIDVLTFLLLGVELLDVQQNSLKMLLPLQHRRQILLILYILQRLSQQFLEIPTRLVKRFIVSLLLLHLRNIEHLSKASRPNRFYDLSRLLVAQLLVQFPEGSPQCGIEVILNTVVGSPWEQL